jgi:hypothetical protein
MKQQISTADVLRHFIAREISKPRYAMLTSMLSDIHEINDDNSFIETVRCFAAEHDSGNPVYTWVFNRINQIKRWVRVDEVDVRRVYSKRINSTVESCLLAERGNLARIAALVAANDTLAREFDLSRLPTTMVESTIIGVLRTDPSRDGTIELIDGAHRLISMIAAGVDHVPAILAELH